MIPVCLYFQVHQPYRLRRYNYFDVGREHRYFDDDANRAILTPVAERCYRPATAMLERLLERHPGFSVAFSLSGTLLEQLSRLGPDVLAAFRRLAGDPGGRVEILAETSHHSLAWLASLEEFEAQVALHRHAVAELLGREPTVFRNTELIYSDALAAFLEVAGVSRRPRRRRRAPHRTAFGTPPLPGRHGPGTAAPAARLPPVRRHRFPFLQPGLERVAADRGEVRRLAVAAGRRRPVPLHGLRDLRRAPVEGDRHLRVLRGLGRPAPRAPRRPVPDAFGGDRAICRRETGCRRHAPCPGPTRRGTSRPGRATTSSATRSSVSSPSRGG